MAGEHDLGGAAVDSGGGAPRPRLTVLIATYNRASYLRGAVQSVLDQSYTDFRLRIFDDASTDATPEVIAAIDDPRVTAVRQPANLGWLGNCNSALDSADTEYVLLLGDDDVMAPGALDRAVEALDAHPGVGLVHASLNVIDGDGDVLVARTAWTRDPIVDGVEPGPTFIRKSISGGCRVCAATVMLRTAALSAMRFDPPDGPAADFGLWLRIAVRWDVYFLATPGVSYRVHAGSDSAQWSIPAATQYVESTPLVLKIREMKLRFIDENAAALTGVTRLRVSANAAAARTLLLRFLGPGVTLWLRTNRRRVKARLAARRQGSPGAGAVSIDGSAPGVQETPPLVGREGFEPP